MKMVALVRYVTVRARRRHESQDKWVQFDAPGPEDAQGNELCPGMDICRPIVMKALGDRVSVLNLRQHQGAADDGLEELAAAKFEQRDELADIVAEVAGEPKRRGRPPKQRILTDEELAQ